LTALEYRLVRGLAVIGASSDADELSVAAGACRALRDAGERPAALSVAAGHLEEAAGCPADEVEPLQPEATPYVAARHAGIALDPADLVARARAAAERATALVVATSGGLLAPLTARYSVRDLVRELELPVVVAARAGRDLVNHALLTIEAARGVGLTVAAIVVTGWPETPSRALLDEYALLRDRWPLTRGAVDASRWLDSAPAEAKGDAEHLTLDAYRTWEPRPLGDPRSTPRAEIMAALTAIVETEGPMRASRAYSVYNRAAGGRKLTAVARAPLSSALYWLARERRVVLTRAEDIPWQQDDLVRMPDSPPVAVRELGDRALEEVPLDEIAELIRRIHAATGERDAMALKRAVLGAYGLVRLTARADEYLGLALDLAEL
jgi:dethiobiotin synthetase